MRTVRAYSGMLYRFFGTLGKSPDQVTATEIFGYAHGTGLSGKKPSSGTIGARIACLSSFYRFLIRMSLVSANPRDQLERTKATLALPRGGTAVDIRKLLWAIPDNPVGLWDKAIVLTLTLIGRRRTEVLNLKAGNLSQEGDAVYYVYKGKSGYVQRLINLYRNDLAEGLYRLIALLTEGDSEKMVEPFSLDVPLLTGFLITQPTIKLPVWWTWLK